MSKSFVGKSSNIVTNIIESSSNDLILKSKNTNLYDVVINDELCVDEIKPYNTDKVLINDIKTNCIKIGSDNNYINMIKYYNNCIQIIGSDDQSNKIIIGYYMMNNPNKFFIGTIALNTKNGNFQCNNIQCNEIQASNLHTHNNLSVLNTITSDHIKDIHNHLNKSYLDTIDQNLSKTDEVEFDRLTITARMYIKNPNDGQLAISLYTHN